MKHLSRVTFAMHANIGNLGYPVVEQSSFNYKVSLNSAYDKRAVPLSQAEN